ncbi:MAG: Histone acetyltransferase kat6b, partial [Marteilia pararefringens]
MVVVDGTLQSNVVAKRSSLFKKTMVRNGQRSPAAGVEPRSSNVLQKRGAAEQCEDQDATLEISPKKWKRSSSSLGRSGGGESVENRAVWRKHFIKALRQIKAGKQRPNTRRLVLILNRDYGYNFQEIMNILDYCVEQGVALKAYVKGEYTYVDPKSESRHPLVITHNYNMSSRVLLAMSENPRGATKQYLIDYILKRFLIEPSGGITHEEVSKLIEKSIDQQIYSGVLQVKDKKSMFLVIESDYFANNLSTNKNFV